jgi:hypothetical protein
MWNSIFFVLKLIFMDFLTCNRLGYRGPQLSLREVNTNQGRLASNVDSKGGRARNVITYRDST